MRDQGVWDDKKQKKYEKFVNDISEKEDLLKGGGIRLSNAKKIAFELKELRVEFRDLLAERNALDANSVEGQADNARFDYLVSATFVYNDSNKPYFKDLADYRNKNTEAVSLEAARRLAQKLYGLDSNHEQNLAENKFLREFDFVDEDLRLLNKDGKLVDREGNLVNEDGRYIDEEGNLLRIKNNA